MSAGRDVELAFQRGEVHIDEDVRSRNYPRRAASASSVSGVVDCIDGDQCVIAYMMTLIPTA